MACPVQILPLEFGKSRFVISPFFSVEATLLGPVQAFPPAMPVKKCQDEAFGRDRLIPEFYLKIFRPAGRR